MARPNNNDRKREPFTAAWQKWWFSASYDCFVGKQSSSDKEICELLAKIFEDGLTKLKKYDGIFKTS